MYIIFSASWVPRSGIAESCENCVINFLGHYSVVCTVGLPFFFSSH